MKPLCSAAVLATVLCSGLGGRAHAGLTILEKWEGVNLEIPDAPGFGDAVTVSDTRVITTVLETVTEVSIWLRLEGSDGAGGAGTMWNGDYHVTLTHESGASIVLVNRIGRDVGHPFGSSGSGMDLILDPAALVDVHLSGDGYLSGTFQPDARGADPTTVVSGSARNAGLEELLANFGGGSGSGAWTLAITDLEPGSLGRLSGWGLTLTGVPEPDDYAVLAGVALLGFSFWRWARRFGGESDGAEAARQPGSQG